MPFAEKQYFNMSKLWKYWENYYKAKGCSYNKILKLTHRKMSKYL